MNDRELLVKFPWIEFRSFNAILTLLVDELSTGDNRFFVVKGASGSGKTRMMLEAAKKVIGNEHSWIACTSAHSDAKQFEKVIYKALQETHRLEHLEFHNRLELLLKQRSLQSDRIILFIDDAHLLSETHLASLYQMVSTQVGAGIFQLVLFIDERDINQLDNSIIEHATTYTIPPLSISETERLIAQLSLFDDREYKFSQQALNELHNMAYGYPGRIINELTKDRVEEIHRKKHLYIAGFIASISILFCLIGYSYINGSSQEDETPKETEVSYVNDREEGLPDFIASLTMGDLLTPYEKTMKINTGEPLVENVNRYVPEKKDSQDQSSARGEKGKVIDVKQLVVNRKVEADGEAAKRDVEKSEIATAVRHYIRLVSASSKSATERILSGRTIPGSLKIVPEGDQWIALLGPYQTKSQAEEGVKKLPHSLQVLLPVVIERREQVE